MKLNLYKCWKESGSPTNEEGEPIIPHEPQPIAIADPQPTIPVVQQPIDDPVMPQSSKHKDTSTPTQKASDANITHIDFQSNNPCDLLRNYRT